MRWAPVQPSVQLESWCPCKQKRDGTVQCQETDVSSSKCMAIGAEQVQGTRMPALHTRDAEIPDPLLRLVSFVSQRYWSHSFSQDVRRFLWAQMLLFMCVMHLAH